MKQFFLIECEVCCLFQFGLTDLKLDWIRDESGLVMLSSMRRTQHFIRLLIISFKVTTLAGEYLRILSVLANLHLCLIKLLQGF